MAIREDTSTNPGMGFGGLRVVSLESRMADQCVRMIEKAGGIAIAAPSMREIPLEDNAEALEFGRALVAGDFDGLVLLTGVGTRHLFSILETRHSRAAVLEAVGRCTTIVRGPKPAQALQELGLKATVAVDEPNTWREVLKAIAGQTQLLKSSGSRIAVQEYGVSNPEFLAELSQAGAVVTSVPVYRWGLPEDLSGLRRAIREVMARTADVLLVTSSNQVRNLLEVARGDGTEEAFRVAAGELVVASVGPLCTQTLHDNGFPVDIEPDHSKLGTLVQTAARRAPEIVRSKRSGLAVRESTVTWPGGKADADFDPQQSVFLKACRGEPVDYTPVWLMRQAGRYMQEYREIRARVPFIDLCKDPQLSAKVAIDAVRRIGADAAILFSDILLILEPMGLGLQYLRGEGPVIQRLIRTGADVDRLQEVDPATSLHFVFDAVAQTRQELDPRIPLIGFSGAPFTLASYIIEGGGSRDYIATKTFMYADKGAWDSMMAKIARAVTAYLQLQIEAGAQAVQLFDSWVGCLSPNDYQRYVLPHTCAIIASLPAETPVIHFGTQTGQLLELQASAGAGVLGVDHRVPIASAFTRCPDVTVQGNLDPVILFSEPSVIAEAADRILTDVAGRPGHIFNLGHGILPGTPVDNVIALVDAVHEHSSR